jgi:hypothetical protein
MYPAGQGKRLCVAALAPKQHENHSTDTLNIHVGDYNELASSTSFWQIHSLARNTQKIASKYLFRCFCYVSMMFENIKRNILTWYSMEDTLNDLG